MFDHQIVEKSKPIPAHRNVLSAASPYFSAMFDEHGMIEANAADITLYGLDFDALEALVEFCYSGRIAVDETTVQQLLMAASLLQIDEVKVLG